MTAPPSTSFHRQPSNDPPRQLARTNGPARGTAIGAALLGRTGSRGYVAVRGAAERDVSPVAAPICGPLDAIVGAMSVTGPSYRMGDDDIETIGRLLVSEAAAVALELGARSANQTPDETSQRGRKRTKGEVNHG
jgi:hypothetical protein